MKNNDTNVEIGDLVLIYLDTSKEFFYLGLVYAIFGRGIYAEWNTGVYDFFLFFNYKIIVIDKKI